MNTKNIDFENKSHSVIKGGFDLLVYSRDGWHVSLRVSKFETILNLKMKLEKKKDFPNAFKLAFQGTILDDDKTVGEYFIRDGSRIDIVEQCGQGYKIYFETADGKTCDLQVDGTETVDITKNVICEKFKLVPAEEQILWFEGALLHHDDMTLDECGLGPHSKLFVLTRFRGSGEIFIRTANGKRFTVAVDEKETIASVKMKIYEKIGLAPNEQILMLKELILENDRTLYECKVGKNYTVNVIARLQDGYQIFCLTMDGRKSIIEVYRNETVTSIKAKIHEKIGLAPEEQKLVCKGTILEDERTANEYGIGDYSVINVVARLRGGLQVFIRTKDGKTVAIEVFKNEKVCELKEKIYAKLGLHPEKQRLEFEGERLYDSRTIGSYRICDNSVINLVNCLRSNLAIYIKTMDRKSYALILTEEETVYELKKKIHDKLGIPNDAQMLEFEGAILEDDSRILGECGIKERSIIKILHI